MQRMVFALVACWLTWATAGNAQTLTWLGVLPSGWFSDAYGVSADGRVVVGVSTDANGHQRAFRWMLGSGIQDLGTLGGASSGALAISTDGSVIVGWAQLSNGWNRAFRWSVNDGIQDLGTLGGSESFAHGVSADGGVVVGRATLAGGATRAFRWILSGGMTSLGTLGGVNSIAYGISANGQVVVGTAQNASGFYQAIRWIGSTIHTIGNTSEGFATAYAASADGGVVVGEIADHAFRWVNGQIQYLGTLQATIRSIAYAVSHDGNTVVGVAYDTNGNSTAFLWTALYGMTDLNNLYSSLLVDGSRLLAARALSADGRFIVGYGYNATADRGEAFLLDTAGCRLDADVNGDRIVDDADLLQVLFAFGTSGSGLPEDVNRDGVVDDADLLEVLFNFGNRC